MASLRQVPIRVALFTSGNKLYGFPALRLHQGLTTGQGNKLWVAVVGALLVDARSSRAPLWVAVPSHLSNFSWSFPELCHDSDRCSVARCRKRCGVVVVADFGSVLLGRIVFGYSHALAVGICFRVFVPTCGMSVLVGRDETGGRRFWCVGGADRDGN